MILYGASGHAKVIMDILASLKIPVKAVFDVNPAITEFLGHPVVHREEELDLRNQYSVIAIGNNGTRQRIASSFKGKFIPALAHRTASISHTASLGEGTVVMAQAAVNADARIGKHCIVNTGAVVEHEVTTGDYVHISPGAAVAGNVSIGEGTQIGIGASVIQGVQIGKWAVIGAGAVIIENVPDYATVVGVPGRIVKIGRDVQQIG